MTTQRFFYKMGVLNQLTMQLALDLIGREQDELVEQMKEVAGFDYQGAYDHIVNNSWSEVKGTDEQRIIFAHSALENVRLSLTNPVSNG